MAATEIANKLVCIQRLIDAVAKVIVFVLYAGIILVVFTSVLSRYIFDVPHNHADPLSKYLLIWLV